MKKSVCVLPETNVLLRYLLNDVPEQYQESFDFFEKVRTGEAEAELLESVIVEAVYILTKFYAVPRAAAAESLQGVLRYKGVINADGTQLLAALGMYATTSCDIVDCILAAKACGKGLFTFEKKLRKAVEN